MKPVQTRVWLPQDAFKWPGWTGYLFPLLAAGLVALTMISSQALPWVAGALLVLNVLSRAWPQERGLHGGERSGEPLGTQETPGEEDRLATNGTKEDHSGVEKEELSAEGRGKRAVGPSYLLILRQPCRGAGWAILLLLLMLGITAWITPAPAVTLPQVWRTLVGIGFFGVLVIAPAPARALLPFAGRAAAWLPRAGHSTRRDTECHCEEQSAEAIPPSARETIFPAGEMSMAWGATLAGVLLGVFALFSVDWATGKLPLIPQGIYDRLQTVVADTVNPNVLAGNLLPFIFIGFGLALAHFARLWPGGGGARKRDTNSTNFTNFFALTPAVPSLRSGQGPQMEAGGDPLASKPPLNDCCAIVLLGEGGRGLPGSRRTRGQSLLSLLKIMVGGGVALLASAFMVGMLLLTQSRGALLGLAGGAGVLLGVGGLRIVLRRIRPAIRAFGAGFPVSLLLLFIALLAIGGIFLASRFFPHLALKELPSAAFEWLGTRLLGGGVNRVEIWNRALYMIRDFPLTGVGMGLFPQALAAFYPLSTGVVPHAHNLFLQIAVDLGLPGLAAWLWIFGSALWQAGRGALRPGGVPGMAWLAAGLLAGLTAVALHGLVDAVVWGVVRPAPLLWGVLALAHSLRSSK